jgi:hypothetical protein
MDTNTKKFLDYMDESGDNNTGSITGIAEKITKEYILKHKIIEETTAKKVVASVSTLVSNHAQQGSRAYDMVYGENSVNLGMVEMQPVVNWLRQKFTEMHGVA